jgi:hypothetical protein
MATTDEHDRFEELDAADFAFTRSAWVDATPTFVYELVSDVSAVSRWSPTASGVCYDDGAGPWAGAWFSGTNRRDGKEWTTRCWGRISPIWRPSAPTWSAASKPPSPPSHNGSLSDAMSRASASRR